MRFAEAQADAVARPGREHRQASAGRFPAFARTGSLGHQPTVATGSFLASRLIEVAAEPTAIWSPERGPAEVGTHRQGGTLSD